MAPRHPRSRMEGIARHKEDVMNLRARIVWLSVMLFALVACVPSEASPAPEPPTATGTALPGAATPTAPVATSAPSQRPLPAGTAVPTPDLSGLSPAELVQAITQGDLRRSVAASEQALARGGIAVMDVGVVYVPAVAPAATRQVWLGEAMALTLEARRRATMGTMTVAELGKMLADFGWPFPPERTPGEHLVVFLSAWVQQAQQS